MSVALVLGVAAGCPTFTLPPGTEVACSTNAECPTGFACRLDRCRPLDGETDAPGLDPQTELGPALVGVGGEVVVELVATEPLSAVVELVAVTASGRSPFVVSDLDEQRATGRWRVPDGEASGTAQVLATLADRAGNVASDVLVGTVALDTELPAVRGVVVGVDDHHVTDGDVVEVQLTASEPLRAGTTLAVAGAEVTPTTTNDGDGDDAIAFRFTVGPEVAAGPVVGTVSLVDRAGNANDVEVELTVVDRTAPTVSERGRTAVGADGAILSVTVVCSEALGAAPTATLVHTDGAVVAADVIDRGDGVYLVTCTVDAAAGVVDGTWRFVIDTIVDVAGNDGAAFVAEGFTVDASAPAFVDTPQVSPFVISRQAGFDATTVRFVVGEAATATVRLNDGTPVDCDSADGRTYACIVVAEDIAASGAAVVFVAVTDVAGNTGFSSAGLVLDDVAPVVLSSNVALRGPPDALVDEVSALGSGARLDVALTIDDRAATVAVTAEPTAFPIARTSAADATPLTFAADVVDDTSEGPVVIGVELTDAVGNRAVVLLDTVEVDRTSPSPPPVDVADAVVYRRVPWGASSTGGSPRFAMALEQLAAGDVVIAWPRANKAANDELARAVVDDDGHADVSLGGTDRGEVFVSVVDGAGNESGVVRVRDVVWTASLGGKVAGSTLENPHGFLQVGNTHNRLEVSSASVLDGGRTGVADGQVAQTQVGVRFTRAGIVTAVDDGQLQQPAASFDAARGRIVAFSAEDSVPETWEHDGQQWQQIVPADPERDGNPPTRFQGAAMAWHGARQVSVLVGGSQSNGLRDTWTWDGRSWAADVCVPRTFVDSAGPSECGPPSLSRPALAYDELAAEVVLFGGSNGGNNPTIYASTTWVWDGSWTRVCTGSCTPPPGREGASLAFDRARGVTVLFGGCDGGEPVAPRDDVVAFCAHEAACKADIDTTICGIREESELRTFEQVGGATCTALAGAFAALSACQTSAPCGQENAALRG